MSEAQVLSRLSCKHLYLRRENIVSGDIELVCLRCGERFILKRRW